MSWTITCACGWTVEGGEDDVVLAAQEHGRRLHNMDVTIDQAMAMASPSVDDDADSDEARSVDEDA
jgi:hypothetical protein